MAALEIEERRSRQGMSSTRAASRAETPLHARDSVTPSLASNRHPNGVATGRNSVAGKRTSVVVVEGQRSASSAALRSRENMGDTNNSQPPRKLTLQTKLMQMKTLSRKDHLVKGGGLKTILKAPKIVNVFKSTVTVNI